MSDPLALARQRMLVRREAAQARLNTASRAVAEAKSEHAIALAEVCTWNEAVAALGESAAEEPRRERMDVIAAVSPEEAEAQGRADCRAGKSISSAPADYDRGARQAWERGWAEEAKAVRTERKEAVG